MSRLKKSALDTTDPPRNFTIPTEERVRALTIGVPAWAARKRRIEDREDELVRTLVDLFEKLIANGDPPDVARARMREKAAGFDLEKLGALVTAHNRYYPIEANLPLDPKTGAYLARGRPWIPEPLPSADALVARAEAILASTR